MGYNLTENLFGYTLVQDILVESATTSVTFSGLNYTAADDLLLVADVFNTSAGTSQYNLYVNGNTTSTNYYNEQLATVSTNVYGARINAPQVLNTTTNGKSFALIKIKMTNNGYFVYQSEETNTYSGSSINLYTQCGTSTFTISSITSLAFIANFQNTISIGSRFRLYKLNATKVADITVGTATTSVDITGLNITKDSEYMLVGEVSNASGTNSDVQLFFNGTTTATSYYTQVLLASSSSVAGARENNAYCAFVGNGNKSFFTTSIKLTNNGNCVWQSNASEYIGGSSLQLRNDNGTSTFTASSITTLKLQGATNAIGVGSRFQLYRMKG